MPLIFANYKTAGSVSYGGIRVETDLLHSQLISSGNNQLLYALMMFGAGPLGEKPDFDGYAIGDLLLRDFAPEKVKLYYEVGRRLVSGDALYPQQAAGSERRGCVQLVLAEERWFLAEVLLWHPLTIDQSSIWVLWADSERPSVLPAVRAGHGR